MYRNLLLFISVLPTTLFSNANSGVISWRTIGVNNSAIHKAAPRAVTDERATALNYLNTLRTGAEMITFAANSLLETAAQTHVDYLFCANQFGHYENQNDCPTYYTGITPSDRISSAGYTWSATSENISGGSATTIEAIDSLMTAIYHRFGFLNFYTDEIGIGYGSDSNYAYSTIHNFDMGNRASAYDTAQRNPDYVLWPYDGYDQMQTTFSNTESPDPLPECPSYGIAGNPLSIEFNPASGGSITMNSFQLFDSHGTEITDKKVLEQSSDPAGDLNDKQFVLFPMTSLNVDSRYSAVFTYTEDTVQKQIAWHFNTRRYTHKRYAVRNANAYDVISGETYLIQLKPEDCTTTFGSMNWSNANNVNLQRLGIDLFLVSVTGDTTISFPNSSSPQFSFTLHVAPSDSAIAPSTSRTAIDFNTDGTDDLLVRNTTTGVTYSWLMNTNGAKQSDSFIATIPATEWRIEGTGDYNGDGITDILVRNITNGQTYSWLMNSDGTRASYKYITTLSDSDWEIAGTDSHFNSDAYSDIVVRHKTLGYTYVWLMNSDGSRGSYQHVTNITEAEWQIAGTDSDFNHDGISDIVVRNRAVGYTYVWLMNSDGTRGSYKHITNLPETQWEIVGTDSDFNRDGTSDIVVREKSHGYTYVWLMNNDGTRASYKHITNLPVSDWEIAGTDSDFNADGTSDLVVRNTSSGALYTWLMNSDGTRASYNNITSIPASQWEIVGTDYYFNQDDSSDIVVRNTTTGATYSWLMNTAGGRSSSVGIATIPASEWEIEAIK